MANFPGPQFVTLTDRCYENAGCRTEGVLRDIVKVGGEYWHWRAMSILDHEWKAVNQR